MLAKENRLKKKKDIEEVFKRGKSFKEKFLLLKIAKNDLETSRFAFIVSKKVAKKANIRNKIKRRLRSLASINLKRIKNGFDYILVTFPGTEKENFEEMEKCFLNVFLKSKQIDD